MAVVLGLTLVRSIAERRMKHQAGVRLQQAYCTPPAIWISFLCLLSATAYSHKSVFTELSSKQSDCSTTRESFLPLHLNDRFSGSNVIPSKRVPFAGIQSRVIGRLCTTTDQRTTRIYLIMLSANEWKLIWGSE
jgi:hypothetical protein